MICNLFFFFQANPNKPFATLEPSCPLLTLEYNPKDTNILASGLSTGQVAFWDIRRELKPIETSLIENSHRDPCDQVLWINSKTGTEFFSAAKDGQVQIYILYSYKGINFFILIFDYQTNNVDVYMQKILR